MDSNCDESCKKCFCARCFMPVDANDKVDIEGQSFHKMCSLCCICRKTPTNLKMFYGHVFCDDCFKSHVMAHFKGETPKVHTNSWWMQWGPNNKAGSEKTDRKEGGESKNSSPPNDDVPPKRSICTRCLQPIEDDKDKIEAGGQCFHCHCARCYCCQEIPKSSIKVYYGQVFCEDCFNKHVMSSHRDNPSEFFKTCFDQWQSNATFGQCMKEFMNGSKTTPFVFMVPPEDNCRCRGNGSEWFPAGEPKKCA